MLAIIWRFFVALFDWRTCIRKITNRPSVDVVFISNMRDEVDRKRFIGLYPPPQRSF